MPIYRKSGGANTQVFNIKRRASGAWVGFANASPNVYRRLSGAWIRVFPYFVSVSPSSVNDTRVRSTTTGTNDQVTLTASGGSGSYNWTVSGTGLSISPSTGATTILTANVVAGTTTVTRSGTVRATNASNSADFFDVPVSVTFEGTA